jgi:alpha/beta superfamily hydrolase
MQGSALIPAPAGHLETLYREGEGPLAPGLPPAALVCHPHPAHGGTMHNKVVYRLARALLERGVHVLRFNFRGVGSSTGAWSGGPGEREDIRCALDHLARLNPGAPLLMAGFSFGAWNGLAVGCEDPRVTRFVGLGLPVGTYEPEAFAGGGRPLFLLHGARDTFGTPSQLEAFAHAWDGPCEVCIVDEADHFFEPRLPLVTEAVGAHLDSPPRRTTRSV